MTLRYIHIYNVTDAPRTMVRLWEGPFSSFGGSSLLNKWSKAKIELTKLGHILKYMFEKSMFLAFSKKEYNIIMRWFLYFLCLDHYLYWPLFNISKKLCPFIFCVLVRWEHEERKIRQLLKSHWLETTQGKRKIWIHNLLWTQLIAYASFYFHA